jgi:hypothetical protein
MSSNSPETSIFGVQWHKGTIILGDCDTSKASAHLEDVDMRVVVLQHEHIKRFYWGRENNS